MVLPPFNVNDLLVKPVYDVAFYGQDKTLSLGTDTLALQSITWSGLNELLQTSPANADSNIEDYTRLISDLDTLGIGNEGDGIRFSRSYEWLSDMSAWVYKFNITICTAIAVTAYTSGNIAIDSVHFTITERRVDGTLVKTIANQTIDTGMTTITSAVNAAAIIHFEGNTPFKVEQGNVVRLLIEFNTTDSGVATTFEGIMPLYFFQEGSLPKIMATSQLILHLHPALDHAFPVFRDQSLQDSLDYDGISIEGVKR